MALPIDFGALAAQLATPGAKPACVDLENNEAGLSGAKNNFLAAIHFWNEIEKYQEWTASIQDGFVTCRTELELTGCNKDDIPF